MNAIFPHTPTTLVTELTPDDLTVAEYAYFFPDPPVPRLYKNNLDLEPEAQAELQRRRRS